MVHGLSNHIVSKQLLSPCKKVDLISTRGQKAPQRLRLPQERSFSDGLRAEIRRGSAAGASPRNGSGSGGKTSGEDASIGMFESASCVCSRFATADKSST